MPPAHALTHKGFLPLLSNQERSSASVFETVFRCMFYNSVGYKVFHLIAKLRATVSAAFLRFRGRTEEIWRRVLRLARSGRAHFLVLTARSIKGIRRTSARLYHRIIVMRLGIQRRMTGSFGPAVTIAVLLPIVIIPTLLPGGLRENFIDSIPYASFFQQFIQQWFVEPME